MHTHVRKHAITSMHLQKSFKAHAGTYKQTSLHRRTLWIAFSKSFGLDAAIIFPRIRVAFESRSGISRNTASNRAPFCASTHNINTVRIFLNRIAAAYVARRPQREYFFCWNFSSARDFPIHITAAYASKMFPVGHSCVDLYSTSEQCVLTILIRLEQAWFRSAIIVHLCPQNISCPQNMQWQRRWYEFLLCVSMLSSLHPSSPSSGIKLIWSVWTLPDSSWQKILPTHRHALQDSFRDLKGTSMCVIDWNRIEKRYTGNVSTGVKGEHQLQISFRGDVFMCVVGGHQPQDSFRVGMSSASLFGLWDGFISPTSYFRMTHGQKRIQRQRDTLTLGRTNTDSGTDSKGHTRVNAHANA